MIRLQEVDESFDQCWDEFVISQPHGTIFQSSKWLKLVERGQGGRKLRYAIYDDKRLIGLFPFFTKTIWPLRIAASPLIVADTPYMGPLIEPEYFHSAMRAFDSLFKKHKIHFVRIMLHGPYSADIASNLGYDIITKQTHILDLTKDEDYLWKKMEGRSRTAVRKAIKSGVVIVEANHRDSIDAYYEMYKELSRRRHQYLPNSKQFFQLMWDFFHPRNLAMLIAEHQGIPVAGTISIRFKESSYYLDAVSLKAFKHLAPNNLLQWETIKRTKEEGCRTYDFVDSDLPWLSKFKRSFGGTLNTYFCLEKASAHWVRFARERVLPKYRKLLTLIHSRR